MIYVILALKAEAQAFVDKKLDINIVTSGVGSENMYNATKKIVRIMQKDDIIMNVGICGAATEFEIGELLEICIPTQSVGTSLSIKENFILSCVDFKVNDSNKFDVVDMESAGFIDATKNIKNRYIFKIVSDHFEPNRVTKDGAKKLIFNKIDEIMQRIKK